MSRIGQANEKYAMDMAKEMEEVRLGKKEL